MPRPLRIEYEGAIYHVMNRGDRREPIFLGDRDREAFLQTLGEACAKTGWQVHAYVLMGNHFHLVLETPQPNLCVGMKWLLGTYTMRFNRRNGEWGHLFGGRYKAQMVDPADDRYLVTACDYVHLNPVRAGMIKPMDAIESYQWSSYPAYLRPKTRPAWLRVDRLLGEHGLAGDDRKALRHFGKRMEGQREDGLPEEMLRQLRRGWRLGAADFAERLAEKLGRRGNRTERASERRETDRGLAERLVKEGLRRAGCPESRLAKTAKGDPLKVAIAREIRRQTPMPRSWIAQRLKMGSASYVSTLLASSVENKN